MFKSTGIIRRIDELGRIVIPKEIRRKLRLRDGDAVEICDDNSIIMMKKYSAVWEMEKSVKKIVNSFSNVCGIPVILCDKTKVLYSKYLHIFHDAEISDELSDMMYHTESISKKIKIMENEDLYVKEFERITSYGEVIGLLIIPDTGIEITSAEKKYLRLCAQAISIMTE